MKKKELRKIAEQIAEYEMILANPDADDWSKKAAREGILDLSRRITNLDDMSYIDDYVQEYLQKI